MVSISPPKREREKERDRVESMRRDARARRALPLVRSRRCRREKREDSTLEPSKSLGKSNPPREREREREPAECPTASAYLDRPVREQVILQILQNVTQTHARDVQNTLSSLARARVKLVPVQRSAESKGTRGSFEEEERRGPIFTLLKGGKKITIKRIRMYSARVLVTVRLIKFFPSLVIITLFLSLSQSLRARV